MSRASNSRRSASLVAFSSESIGARCSTVANASDELARDALRRGVGRDQLGMGRLQVAELAHERVVLGVGDLRPVERVVEVVVAGDQLPELVDTFPGRSRRRHRGEDNTPDPARRSRREGAEMASDRPRGATMPAVGRARIGPRRARGPRTTLTGATMRQNERRSAPPNRPSAVSFEVPPGACDCHTHIHGDPERFPFFAGRVYTPEMALPSEMAALHKALRVQRVVIVTPSVYGTDNSATLYGMEARGADARGVAVIDDAVTESELDAMGGPGMRGIRLNLATSGMNDAEVGASTASRAAAERMARRDWHVQIYTTLPMISGDQGPRRRIARAGRVRPLRRRAGAASASSSPASPICWSSSARATRYVKISGAYRASTSRQTMSTSCRSPGR